MTLRYRTTGPWGPGEGQDLEPEEVDENFFTLQEQIDDIVGNPPAPLDIADIVVSGSTFTVVLSDATVLGPYQLPVATISWFGLWQAETILPEFALFYRETDGLYLVLREHTSEETFDPELEDTDGPVYQKLFDFSLLTLTVVSSSDPTYAANAVTESTVLVNLTNAEGAEVTVPITGEEIPLGTRLSWQVVSAGAVLTVVGDQDTTDEVEILVPVGFVARALQNSIVEAVKTGDNQWTLGGKLLQVGYPPVDIDGATDPVTLSIGAEHAGRYLRLQGDTVVEFPEDSAGVPIGTEVHFRQCAPGTVVFSGITGVTVNPPAGYEASSDVEGAVVTAKLVGAAEWDLFGLLTAEEPT